MQGFILLFMKIFILGKVVFASNRCTWYPSVFLCFGNIYLGYYTPSGSLELTVISAWNGLNDISAPSVVDMHVLCKYSEYIFLQIATKRMT